MVSGESETFVSRVRRVSARARRVETKPLDVSVGRVYSQTVGAVRWGWGDGSRRVTSRGAPSRTARALNALVTVVMVRAFHSTLFKLWRRGRRARRAGRASANVKFQTSLFLHTCFSASVSRVESRQSPGFCAAPIGRGDSANLLSTTNPNDAQSSRQSST